MISILMPCYKSYDLLKNVFIPSLKNTNTDYEVILRDNGNEKDIREFSGDFIKIIGDGNNIGLNAGLNDCYKYANGSFIYLTHPDMFLLPGWDKNLLEASRGLPPTSYLMCSRSIEPTKGHTDYHIIENYGMEPDEFRADELTENYKEYKNNSIVVGARMPFFLHRKLWEKMSGVDEAYFSYCTDDDLIQEAYDKGCRRFWVVYGSLVYHLQGKSNEKQDVDKDSDAPYTFFIDKWRKRNYTNAEHPAYWHPKLINFCERIR
jgi:GT2 family glycosyltransferase